MVGIRSYRRVFEVDRRLYRIDRWALPVPGGIPLVGVAYFFAVVFLVAILGQIPGFGTVLGVLSPPLRYVVLPLGVAMFASQGAPDGRSAHRFAWHWVRYRLRRRKRKTDLNWSGRVVTRWDIDAPHLHRSRVRGVAQVDFSVPVALEQRRNKLIVRPGTIGQNESVVLGAQRKMEVRP